MNTPITQHRCAVYYRENARVVTDTSSWFTITVSKIHGRRHLYTDLQEYIRTHSSPGIMIPDARVVTQDVAQQIVHFMIRTSSLGVVIYYDRPENVPEVMRYFVSLVQPVTDNTVTHTHSHIGRVVESLANAGFLTSTRSKRYLMN